MRVLALTTDAFGGRGGIARYNRDFLAALAGCSQIEEITVLTRSATEGEPMLPTKVAQLSRLSKTRYAATSARLLLGRRSVDGIFCGHINLAPLATVLSLATKTPVWLQLHGIEAWHRPTKPRRVSAESADLITAVSRYTRSKVLGWGRVEAAKIKVLSNTVDDRYLPGPSSASLRHEYGIDNRRILLTVSRLAASERYKGHDLVIRALPEILSRHPDVAYLIIGDGDDRERLEQLVIRSGMQDNVRFAGYVPEGKLLEYYRTADLFLMPSTGEGFGIAYLEAMASGTPALGLGAGGAPDALADGELGIVSTATNIAEDVCRVLEGNALGGEELAIRTRARFGRAVFEDQVRNYVGLFQEGLGGALH